MTRKIVYFNSLVVVGLMLFFFIFPVGRALLDIQDPALRQPGVPKAAWRLYRNLTPRYAAWAQGRVVSKSAEQLTLDNVSGTEWPLFGSVFYIWGIENLQAAWDAGDHSAGVEPKIFAREAMIAASELVIDPKQASWVKKYWGENYLHQENVFYRMLVIAALTGRENLLHDHAHLDMLRDQVETFAKELDAAKSGLLDDYPSQCFPGDVMAALMCIKRADAVLGTDHAEFLSHALRGFIGERSTPQQLPPYAANSEDGSPCSDARGCGNSYMCLAAPELWPMQAKKWFTQYDDLYWQQNLTTVGYREFPKGAPNSEWTMDVDAGPVIAGHGVAANAFGIGAARKNGRFDRAYPLSAEMLATIGELPNGVLVVPRLLSNASDAPLLGEAGILWQLSVQPEKGFTVTTGGRVPAYAYIVLTVVFLFGVGGILAAMRKLRAARRPEDLLIPAPKFQAVVWACFMLAAIITYLAGHPIIGVVTLCIGVTLPVTRKKKKVKQAEAVPVTAAT